MRLDILTLFPEMFAPLEYSMISRARDKGLFELNITNIRDFATDKHQITDDRLYGGGAGMVLKPEPLSAAIRAAQAAEKPRIIITSPAGRPYDQALARELSRETQLIIVAGHYEGIDQRIIDSIATDVISLGDFVLTGGEIAALAIADSVLRLLPGVLGGEGATEAESFSDGLLEYPQYTRPAEFEGQSVPPVLLSGDHARIAAWRRERQLELTLRHRPDLLTKAPLSAADAAYLGQLRRAMEKPFTLSVALLHHPVYNKKRQPITTSLTNLDLHDIARAAATYALQRYYIVQPIAGQRQMMDELLAHWQSGFGAKYNPDRTQALALARIMPALADVIEDMRAANGEMPRLIATGAALCEGITGFDEMREQMHSAGGHYLLLLGTGYGLTDDIIAGADFRLQPIFGREGYNHLSVRSAAAIMLDRLLK